MTLLPPSAAPAADATRSAHRPAADAATTGSPAAPHATRTELRDRRRVLTLSTLGFTLMFAVWLMFGVLGIPISKEFGLSEVQLAWLGAVAILNGSLWRLFAGMAADRFGGKIVMTVMIAATAVPAFLVSQAASYQALLLCAFLAGFAGNVFSVGIAWNAAWYPPRHQGFALGVFGAGNVGASVTKLFGPVLITVVPAAGLLGGFVPGGWRFIPFAYAVLLVLMAVALWFGTPRVDRRPGQGRPLVAMLRPLKQVRVWRFSLYYVVVFGAYVALSTWLPHYYVDVYGQPLIAAGLLTALFIFPASLLRPVGGSLSDRFGARRVLYWSFGAILAATAVLAMPYGHVVLYGPTGEGDPATRDVLAWEPGVVLFTVLVVVIGVAMGVGKAAVYKYVPDYFPSDVGAVGGLVGMLGALGGFFLPPLFAYAHHWTGAPQSTFGVLFVLTLVSAVWLHLTVMRMVHQRNPELKHEFEHGYQPDAPGSQAPAAQQPTTAPVADTAERH